MRSLCTNCGQLLAGLGQRHAVADEDHGALGTQQQLERGGDLLRRGAAALGAVPGCGRRHLHVVLLLEHVERHVHVHRPRPPRQHGRHGLAQDQRQHVDAGRLEAALHDGTDDVGEVRLVVAVDLLERAAVELLGRHVGGDGEHGGRIRHRHLQRHDDVAGAGAAGSERCHRLVAHAEVGVRHVRCDLLVARRDQLDAVAGVVERVEHADVAVPADAEHVGDLVLDQVFGDQLSTLHARHCIGSIGLLREGTIAQSCARAARDLNPSGELVEPRQGGRGRPSTGSGRAWCALLGRSTQAVKIV